MTQDSKEGPEACSFCKERPAVERYTRKTIDAMLCERCLDRMAVQDALDDSFLHIVELERNERYDEALACMDSILEENRHRDHDHWLARSVASHRALVLWQAGRLEEAEKACDAWAELGFADLWGRNQHASQKALILEELGRHAEGVTLLEDALSYRDPKYLPDARHLLAKLAELSEKLGQPVDPKWRRLAEKVARRFRTELPIRDTLGESLIALREITLDVEPKRPHEWKQDEADDEAP